MASCDADGHIFAGDGVCVFCKLQVAPPNKNDPWQLIAADPDLVQARRRLSMHEIRRFIRAGSLGAYEEAAKIAQMHNRDDIADAIRRLGTGEG